MRRGEDLHRSLSHSYSEDLLSEETTPERLLNWSGRYCSSLHRLFDGRFLFWSGSLFSCRFCLFSHVKLLRLFYRTLYRSGSNNARSLEVPRLDQPWQLPLDQLRLPCTRQFLLLEMSEPMRLPSFLVRLSSLKFPLFADHVDRRVQLYTVHEKDYSVRGEKRQRLDLRRNSLWIWNRQVDRNCFFRMGLLVLFRLNFCGCGAMRADGFGGVEDLSTPEAIGHQPSTSRPWRISWA